MSGQYDGSSAARTDANNPHLSACRGVRSLFTLFTSRRWKYRTFRYGIALSILLACVSSDQATKVFASEHLRNEPPVSLFGDTLRFQYALNQGGFLGIGAALSPDVRFMAFVGFNLVVLTLGAICVLARWNMPLWLYVSFWLLAAGGIGNLIDRLRQNGFVTDFINIGFGSVRTGIFNVADVAVVAGLTMAVWYLLQTFPATRSLQQNIR